MKFPEKIKVEYFTYEKVKKSDVAINIPTEPIFFQDFNHRVLFGVFPKFATWSNNSVYRLDIVRLTGNEILKTYVPANSEGISAELIRSGIKEKSQEDLLKQKVIDYLLNDFEENRVAEEDFKNKFQEIISSIESLLTTKSI